MSPSRPASLRRILLRWYARHGRADLPWRRKRSPYRTLVSEFMLQQTQVDRVIPKFEAFLRRFPTIVALASATPGDVLREWRGLGYNARAVRLQSVAASIVREHRGRVPRDLGTLRALPGVGAYTAAAIRAFAYDLDGVPIDVNVGRVLHRLFFGVEHPARASARDLAASASVLCGRGGNAIASALMDLGAQICTAQKPACARCPLRRDCVAAPIDAAALRLRRTANAPARARIPFERSARYARGRIIDRLRDLPPGERISLLDLHGDLSRRNLDEVRTLVDGLQREGLVCVQDDAVSLP